MKGKRRMMVYLLLGLSGFYLVLLVVMTRYQHKLVFHPDRRDMFLNGATAPFAIVSVETADGLTLRGYYTPPAAGRPVIVYFHGNAGNAASRLYKAARYIAAGYGFLLAEYRGFGGNPGLPSETGLYDDARAWLAFLGSETSNTTPRVYYGESLGTGVAVQMAVERAPQALILEAPFTSVPDVGAFYYPFLPVRRLAKHRFDSISKAGTLTMPVLICHGTRDITVPYRFGQRLFDAIPSTRKKFVSFVNARHTDLYQHAADARIMEFLHDHAL